MHSSNTNAGCIEYDSRDGDFSPPVVKFCYKGKCEKTKLIRHCANNSQGISNDYSNGLWVEWNLDGNSRGGWHGKSFTKVEIEKMTIEGKKRDKGIKDGC